MAETSGSSTHDLLLAMAGQVDDDLLAWARELVAVGENTRAIALVTAGVTADRTSLRAALRATLVAAARAAHTDLDAGSALPEASDSALDHRFAAAPPGGDDRVAAAVGALPPRLLDGAEVRLAWRLTPAGSAPGPLPHPVVLVEVEAGGRPADVLAYQLSVALDRSGVVASVEVLTSGNPLSEYHAAARRAAQRIHEASATAPPVVAPPAAPPVEPVVEPVVEATAPEPRPEPGYADLWAAEGPFAVPGEPSGPDAAATDPTGTVVGDITPITPASRPLPLRPARDAAPAGPESRPAPRPFERRRTTVTPLTRSSLPSPVPLARRDGTRVRPLVPVHDETPVDTAGDTSGAEATDPQRTVRPDGGDAYSSLEQEQIPALADTPMFRSMQDPLSGPLNAPLLAPLLDPTPFDEHGTPVEDEDDDPFGLHGISPLAPDRPIGVTAPAPAEDRWANEWASGDWAVSPSDLDRSGPDRSGPDRSGPDRSARTVEDEPGSDPGSDVDEIDAPRHRAAHGLAEAPPASAPPIPLSPLASRFTAESPIVALPPTGPAASAVPPAAAAPQPPAAVSPPTSRPPTGPPTPAAPRSQLGSPAPNSPRSSGPDRAPAAPEPAREEQAAEGPGLRPDPVARLSDADRELLARLQAELGSGTRPRTSRRAGVAAPNGNGQSRTGTNGNGTNGNGPGRHDPPDLAG